MKTYRIASRNPLDILSQDFCTKIIEYFKNNILPDKTSNNWHENVVIDNINIPFFINTITQDIPLINGNFQISGETRIDMCQIGIHIDINKNFSLQNIDAIYKRLAVVVRHEIEHRFDCLKAKESQNIEKYKSQSQKAYSDFINAEASSSLQDRLPYIQNYLSSEVEMVPYIRAIMSKSKKEKTSFKDNLDRFLEIYLYGHFNKDKISQNTRNKVTSLKEQIKSLYVNKSLTIYQQIV